MPKLIIANWKSNHNLESALGWVETVGSYLKDHKPECKVILAPPFPLISALSIFVQNECSGYLELAIQDLSFRGAGSFTGEVCAENLKGLGVKYAILGHSERRELLGENDQEVALKVVEAVAHQLQPIVCVDEGYYENQMQLVKEEAKKANISFANQQLSVAYEPPGAISTVENASTQSTEKVAKVVSDIKNLNADALVIYGGSVNAKNISEYLEVTNGVLVGGASLKSGSFVELLKRV